VGDLVNTVRVTNITVCTRKQSTHMSSIRLPMPRRCATRTPREETVSVTLSSDILDTIELPLGINPAKVRPVDIKVH
jgi:hypothetical protein